MLPCSPTGRSGPAIALHDILAGDIMADLKTKVNNTGVEDSLNRVGNAKRREDRLPCDSGFRA